MNPLGDPPSTRAPLRGEIVFADDAPPFSGATLYVSLEDTTYADADSVTIERLVRRGVAHDPRAGGRLAFELHGEVPDERARYTLSVLIDLDGDGRASRGDYVNKQDYPVLTRGHPNEVSVRVERI